MKYPKNGKEAIKKLGHRAYVGAEWKWELLGKLQFNFLINNGLQKEDTLLDIACGSLRGGKLFIEYLDKHNYIGLDKEEELINAGCKYEISHETLITKSPQFIVSDKFDFSQMKKMPNVALAQSLFTHLTPYLIELCLKNLFLYSNKSCDFFATFFESNIKQTNPEYSNDHIDFYYTKEQIIEFGNNCGWGCEYIGNWDHPANQIIVKFIKK